MPKVFEESGFAGRFYMADLHEPIHIHVTKDGKEAKFWVSPIACANSGGLSRRDLRRAEDLVQKYLADILNLWHEAEEARRNAGRRG
jgi:hypothetical protein